jgi:hypothetical protein
MSFGGYAVAQIQKAKGLNKKMNWERDRIERKDVLDFCLVWKHGRAIPLKELLKHYDLNPDHCGVTFIDHMTDCFNLYLSEYDKGYKGIAGDDSNQLRLSAIPKGVDADYVMFYNWREYSKHCKEYKEYLTWLSERNVQRYVDIENHNQQIDGKNLMHCRRLLDMAMEIAESGDLIVRRPNSEYLLSIRKGKVSLEDIISKAEEDIKKLDELYANCNLPEDIEPGFINDLMLQLRKM